MKMRFASVKAWLQKHSHSQAWLAKEFGHSEMWASRLLRGESQCSAAELTKLAEITGIPLETLAKECE